MRAKSKERDAFRRLPSGSSQAFVTNSLFYLIRYSLISLSRVGCRERERAVAVRLEQNRNGIREITLHRQDIGWQRQRRQRQVRRQRVEENRVSSETG